MTITFSMTARDVVTRAMRHRQVLAIRQQPTGSELAYGVETLNLILKRLASKGVSPWIDVDGSATITANVASVVLAPRPIDVLEARLSVSATYQRPMTRWEQGDYATLPNPSQSGEPLIYSLRFTPTDVTMRVWPVPVSNRTILYSYQRVIEDVDENTALDLPQTWSDAIVKMLASGLSTFGGDPIHIAKIDAEAAMAETELLDFDRPDSYFLESSCQP